MTRSGTPIVQSQPNRIFHGKPAEIHRMKKFKRILVPLMIILSVMGLFRLPLALADPNQLSIYEIQYTTDPAGSSSYAGQVVNCRGGIVIHKYPGYRPRLILLDPNYSLGWGGITVKDWLYPAFAMFNAVQVGDWVSFQNVFVEEYRGNTLLQYQSAYNPSYTIVSHNHPLPPPLPVEPNDIAGPVEGPPWEWYVADHHPEKYEAMLLKVKNVIVTQKDLGKALDNYILEDRRDPNFNCWAADYMNEDKPPTGDYHPYVEISRQFCSVTGILEQYTLLSYGWDYYQLLTRNTNDFGLPVPADLDGSCTVDLLDFSLFADHWLQDDCCEPNWCEGADLAEPNGIVDINDLTSFTGYWLDGTP